jgi:hypothetical protein
VRDSGLDTLAKCAAYTLSTYVNAKTLTAFPAVGLVADGASASRRATGKAIERLELAGFLEVSRSRGRSSHTYRLTLPNRERDAQLTANEVRGSADPTAHLTTPNRASDDLNRAPGAQESAESAESVLPEKRRGRAPAARPDLAYLDSVLDR